MFLPFNQLPESARVWIYQSNRDLATSEQDAIAELLTTFCDGWSAHGAGLKSSFQILHGRFIVIAVDETYNLATGCSIDASVNQIKHIENKFELNFMDRTQVAFYIDKKLYIESLSAIKSKVQEGVISAETKTFNNLVQTVGDFNSGWMVSANNSWLKRYF
ncbi:hypothetical protein MNBD_BACTEROID06-1290 [hydrothermal vent metagenome]|uniref:ABC transporter ATPase n=1 Tax=hydrothermal vent metagenome TaxID=652676 RepID=A0A3B0UCD0_9ZZZZ